jgi:hypothetical protein
MYQEKNDKSEIQGTPYHNTDAESVVMSCGPGCNFEADAKVKDVALYMSNIAAELCVPTGRETSNIS